MGTALERRSPALALPHRCRPDPLAGALAMTAVRVLTVDDQAVFRATARDLIHATNGFEPVGEAASGEAALSLVDELQPQLVLMDVRMPGMDGIEATRQVKSAHPSMVVILISVEERANLPAGAGECPADAVVQKQNLRPALLRALWDEHGTGRHQTSDTQRTRMEDR